MDYFIATLVKGEPQKYQNNLIKTIEVKFNIKQAKTPSHLTLIPPSKTNNIKDISKKIERFTKSNKKTKYKIEEISNFDTKVIFIDVKPSKEMETQYNSLIKLLNYKPDKPTHFHLTLAKRLSQNKFQEIKELLKTQKPKFETFLDNITILELVKGQWKIYKEFKF